MVQTPWPARGFGTALPDPESPAGQHFDWASAGRAHPDSPVGRARFAEEPSVSRVAISVHALRLRVAAPAPAPAARPRRAAPRLRKEAAAEAAPAATHWVEFRYVMKGTGLAVSDPVAGVLAHPSGRREEAAVSKGKLRRDGVEPGRYELLPRHLAGVSWDAGSVHAGEQAGITVSGPNVPDGETVEIQVFALHAPEDAPPLQALQARFSRGAARASWAWEQARGQAPHGEFVARARWRSKCAESVPLHVCAYPADDERGLQQRLKHLGLHDGAIDGATATTAPALKQLQEAWPFLRDVGVTESQCRELLAAATY